MKVSFSGRTSLLDDDVGEDIRNRIHFALSRFSPRIEQVRVQITDVVRDTTSPQKLCRLSVRIKRLGSFSVDSVEEQLASAVSRAADRAARQIERILDGQRDQTRRA